MKRSHFLRTLAGTSTLPLLTGTARAAESTSARDRGRHASPGGVVANGYTKVGESPDRLRLFVGSATLCAVPGGRRLLAGYEWFNQDSNVKLPDPHADICASDDGGRSWRKISSHGLTWASLFHTDSGVFIIGQILKTLEIAIIRSQNGGETWTRPTVLFPGKFTGAPTSVVFKNGFAYRAIEEGGGTTPDKWKSCVVAGNLGRDLLDSRAWRISPRLDYPGTPDTLTRRRYPPGKGYRVPADGWLEGNVVDGRDGLRVQLRVRIDGMTTAGLTAVCDLEDDGVRMNYRFGQFYPMPGAQGKFHIIYDPASNLYWTAVNIPPNTLGNPDALIAKGYFGVFGNERRILLLNYSYDALNWYQAGCIVISRSPMESFSQASLLIHGDDLLVLARTSVGGHNQHDTNLITLHRVENFRALALNLAPELSAQ